MFPDPFVGGQPPFVRTAEAVPCKVHPDRFEFPVELAQLVLSRARLYLDHQVVHQAPDHARDPHVAHEALPSHHIPP